MALRITGRPSLPRAAPARGVLRVRACAQPRRSHDEAGGQRPGRTPRAAPGEALMSSLSDLHRASGRAPSGLNLVLGLDNSEEAWRCIDRRVNTYPSLRSFTSIGSGGSSFRVSMVSAVQAVVGRVEVVSQRSSSGGRYVSVTVGPVLVRSPDDVAEVYSRMRGDGRLRYFL